MKIEYLISTMNRNSIEFTDKMNIDSDIVIINQYNNNMHENYIENNKKISIISCKERGLSRSRNKAIEYSNGDICVICDDDITYYDNTTQVIREAYTQYNDADIIVFQIKNSKDELYKNYKKKSCKVNLLSSMRVSSVEITFKRKSIVEKSIKFNENFGAGSRFTCGEENIFLYECIKKGLKVVFIPKTIGQLQESQSSWFNGFNKKYFRDKGAVYYALSNKIYIILIIIFAIRKRNLYNDTLKVNLAIKEMLCGVKEYKTLMIKEK